MCIKFFYAELFLLSLLIIATLTIAEWAQVEEMLTSLEPTFALGKTLQTENLSPGEKN